MWIFLWFLYLYRKKVIWIVCWNLGCVVDESIDFINRLLIRKQDKRLGAGGIDELKNHKWFWKFDWDALYNQELLSPFIF